MSNVKQEQKQEPWEAMPHVWKTRSSYFSWLRGILRRGWNRHPAKIKLLNERRYKIKNPNPKGNRPEVWGLRCDCCDKEAPMKEFEVDHVVPAGSLMSWEDVSMFVYRLLGQCSDGDLRIVCKVCHQIISYAERSGLSFEEAAIEKQIIALKKLNMSALKCRIESEGIPVAKGMKKADMLELMRVKLLKENQHDCI